MIVERVCDAAGRNGTLMSNGLVRVIIEDAGGMVPEFSFYRNKGYTNAHWIPHFRGNTELYNDEIHRGKWGSRMMYNLCGNFPCIPNFGPESRNSGKNIPPNGYTANEDWIPEKMGTGENYAYLVSTMPNCDDFSFIKKDILLKNHYVHYSVIDIEYRGSTPQHANVAWHNTVAAPFLQAGCYLDAVARGFTTAPFNALPGQRERLAPGVEFDYLDNVPFKDGSTGSLREVPGMIGYSDFITGAVPKQTVLGWSAILNPVVEAIYLPLFQGPAGVTFGEIPLLFNNFWLQYGGRPFWPWSNYTEGTDITYAVGAENSISALAHGLDLSLELDYISGNPTYITFQPNTRSKLYYATMLSPIENSSNWLGIATVEIDSDHSIVIHEKGNSLFEKLLFDTRFSMVKEIEENIES